MTSKRLKILSLCFFLTLFAAVTYLFTAKESTNTDAHIIQKAEEFIISQVGQKEFEKNYELSTTGTDCDGTDPYGCYLRYKFIPGDTYGGSEYILYYYATSNKVEIANNFVPLTLPSCEKDRGKCNFHISLEELKSIAEKENLNTNRFRLIMHENRIVIEASYCHPETTENRRKIFVDPTSGAILWRGENPECLGVL